MGPEFTTRRLIALRKLTRAVQDCLAKQITEYLSTLAPLFRPTTILGEYVSGHARGSVRGAERAFKELRSLYETVASDRPFKLGKDLKAPVEILSSVPELSPLEYIHTIQGEPAKNVAVTSPFRWILSYAGYTPARLRDLLESKDGSQADRSAHVLHALVMNVVVEQQQGLGRILEALHFPISTIRQAPFGSLPLTCIASSIPTRLPPDEVILESSEISGMDVFEEVVVFEEIEKLSDGLRDRLLGILAEHAAELNPVV